MILALDKQVVSRALAERMKARGFPQETLWTHCFSSAQRPMIYETERLDRRKENVAAPTAAEIMELLRKGNHLVCIQGIPGNPPSGWPGRYEATSDEIEEAQYADTAAEALGELWLKVVREK